jgi:DNA-binding FadR family transcriptional regulator
MLPAERLRDHILTDAWPDRRRLAPERRLASALAVFRSPRTGQIPLR